MRKIARYGWVQDFPDRRDYKLAPARGKRAITPARVDLRAGCPPIRHQGNIGSCTGQGWAFAHQYAMIRDKDAHVFAPSALQIYYDEREMEGNEHSDSGAMIRDGAKVLAKLGTCPDYMWPYSEERLFVKPPRRCYVEAREHQALTYWRVPQSAVDFEACLADRFPIVFGYSVYDSFEGDEVARTGIVPMPDYRRESVVGGHCVAMVGYDKVRRTFLCRNSWGTEWGIRGYFWMPYEYLTDPELSDDFWTLRKVEGV